VLKDRERQLQSSEAQAPRGTKDARSLMRIVRASMIIAIEHQGARWSTERRLLVTLLGVIPEKALG
jgi:hypothetical protein